MPVPRPSRVRAQLEELLADRILVLDGSMGAFLFSQQPSEEDYRGRRFRHHGVPLKNCTDILVLSQPQLIEKIHHDYLEAGADIVETNTFTANALSLAEFQLEGYVFELNRAAAEARQGHELADDRYQSARDTLGRMLNQLKDPKLADVPRLQELRLKLLEDALAF